MVGRHHCLNGHECEQALEDGEGPGSPVRCSPLGRQEPLSPQAVAAREEGVGISLIEPRQIPEIETQTDLWSQPLRRQGGTCPGGLQGTLHTGHPPRELKGTLRGQVQSLCPTF